jgi:tRNA G18 (ribose-2'-O)-methylase SpoU
MENEEFDQDDQQQDQKKQEAGKVRKKFQNALNTLTKVLGGESLYKTTSLVPSEIQEAVKALAKEEKEKLIKEFKEKAIALIHKKRDHDKHVLQLQREFEQKQEQGMKDFTKDANSLFGMLKNIQNIEKNYYDILLSTEDGKISESAKADAVDLIKNQEEDNI